ncbi:MAG: Secretion system C-terminal sorting domain [Bacteroidota bacterium]
MNFANKLCYTLNNKAVSGDTLLGVEADYNLRQGLYETLRTLPDSRKDSLVNYPPIDNFYLQGQSSNFEVMAQIDSLLGDTTIGMPAAFAAVNAFNPVNQIEQNFKDYYLYYLGYITCGALSSADSMALYQLASSCPDIQGTSVFRALALYHSLSPDDMITMNNCDRNIETEDRGERKRNIKNINNGVEIYPNPSNGSFEIIVPDESSTYLISIVNYIGQQVYTSQSINSSIINMKTDFPSGVYMITIKNKTTNENTIQKIVVE